MGVLVMFCFLARVLVIYHCLCKFIEQCIFEVYILEMIQAEKYYVVTEIIKCDLFDSNNDSAVGKEYACRTERQQKDTCGMSPSNPDSD